MKKKYKEERQFWEKLKKNVGKAKTKFSTNLILKKNSIKIFKKKKHVGETLQTNKNHVRETL